MNLEIDKRCEGARYSDILNELITALLGKEVLRLEYEADYSGYVDIDVLLEDGRVISYKYWYGSCSGCDGWIELPEKQIKERMKAEMQQEATFFESLESYGKWRKMVNKENER